MTASTFENMRDEAAALPLIGHEYVSMTLPDACGAVSPLDESAMNAARERQKMLLKPEGSLGVLEDISIRMAGITGHVKNSVRRRVHFLFGSDHGVCDEGVSGSPQYITKVLMQSYAAGGCGINVLCDSAGVDLRLFDLGVKDLGPTDGINSTFKLMPGGTENFAKTRAMDREIAEAVIEMGINLAARARAEGYQILGAGEVGMGNTTPAAACIMAALGTEDTSAVGRGGGLTDEAFENKKRVVLEALRLHKPDKDDAIDIISCVGGLDIAAMTGIFIGAAACRVPVVIDGVISAAAALMACKMVPLCREYMFASHISQEPAYSPAVEAIGLTPFLALNMRLGEGTGCPIAMQIIDDALAVMNNMATFGDVSLESEYREELVH